MVNLLLNLRVHVFFQLNNIFSLWQVKSGKLKDKSCKDAGVSQVRLENSVSVDRPARSTQATIGRASTYCLRIATPLPLGVRGLSVKGEFTEKVRMKSALHISVAHPS
jgi:hypothetical protein